MKDKLSKFRLISLSLLFVCKTAFSQVHYKLYAQYRSTPGAKNILGTVAYDGLIWGLADKQNPLYGYYKLGLVAGGAPTVGAFIELAPIAPLVFKFEKSSTYRFLKSSIFDCEQAYCYGTVDRTDTSVNLGFGYRNIIGVVSYLSRVIRTPMSSKSIVLDLENFTITPGIHNYREMTLFAGYKLDEKKTLGFHYSAGEISEGIRKVNALYAIYQWKWHWNHQQEDQELDLTFGVGNYQTDQDYVSGNGVLFALGKKFGESLSLF